MIKKYYFDNTNLDTNYSTLWDGELLYNGNEIIKSNNYFQESNRELDDLLANYLGVNFYVTLLDKSIYISCCSDFKFYFYDFEKNIKNTILEIENLFKINIYNGNFNANELKHGGNQFKYNLSKNKDNKLVLKKKVLNWFIYESKKKKINDTLLEKLDNLNI
jgi:hypothetical protein